MPYVITQSCCNDATCVAVCPVDCIHPTPNERSYASTDMLYVDPDACIECGACAEACPVDAVYMDDELPDAYQPYIQINANYYNNAPAEERLPDRIDPERISTELGTLRVAVVGTGPAACYAASMLTELSKVEVDMIDRLPTPFGLVRGGVAPDHLNTKQVADAFGDVLRNRKTECFFNVEVGTHLSHADLLVHHHAVVYAVGASHDRRLGVDGEDLPGSHAATEFVAWYNGHPDFADRTFDFTGTRAVVVGNGNVALDIARVLVMSDEQLVESDIAEHAIEALRASNIREVEIIGRRGPVQASFTNPELLALGQIPGVDIVVDPESLTDLDASAAECDPRTAHRIELLREFSERPTDPSNKRITLRFLASPKSIEGSDRVESITLLHNELTTDTEGRQVARDTGRTDSVATSLVFRSIGYKGTAIPNLPFDDDLGVVPNMEGRVLDGNTGRAVPGTYVAGWIKRGPSGVIGTNKQCSRDTVSMLIEDFVAGRLPEPTGDREAFEKLVESRQPDRVDLKGWKRIDTHELNHGKKAGRPRLKLVNVSGMLRAAQPTD